MHKVAEFPIAEGIVTKILNDCPAIRVCMRLADLVFRESRKALQQKRLYLIAPKQVDDLLMSQD